MIGESSHDIPLLPAGGSSLFAMKGCDPINRPNFLVRSFDNSVFFALSQSPNSYVLAESTREFL